MTTYHRIITSAIVGLALAASPAPAFAQPSDVNANGSLVPAIVSAPREAINSGRSGSIPSRIVRVTAPGGSFDWGDAGIGAAGGVVLSILTLGGALTRSQRHERRTGRSAAATN